MSDEAFKREEVLGIIKIEPDQGTVRLEIDDDKIHKDDVIILLSKYITSYLENLGVEND